MHTRPPKRGVALAMLIAVGAICPLIATSSHATPSCDLFCVFNNPAQSDLGSIMIDGRSFNVEYKGPHPNANGYTINLPRETTPYTFYGY